MSFLNGVRLKDADGDIADVIQVNGSKGLVTLSPGHISTLNSTASTLGVGGVFEGTWEEITNFGIVVVTVNTSHASATDGLEVYFSSDGTNIDSCDHFTVFANTGKTFSFQAATRYMKIEYTNGTSIQTHFRLQTILKPYYVKPSSHRIMDNVSGEDDAELGKVIIAAKNQRSGEYLNVEATESGHLKTSICDSIVGFRCAAVTPNRNLKTAPSYRLVGTAFDGDTKDTNFWTEDVDGSGSITKSGEVSLGTGTTADSYAIYKSIRRGRFVPGAPMEFKAIAEFYTIGAVNNVRMIGPYDDDNGFYFKLDGTTFKVGLRTNKSGSPVDTDISSGSFNGDVDSYVMDTEAHKFSLEYSAKTIVFIIDGALIHTLSLGHESRPTTFTFPITLENTNSSGGTADTELHVFTATIYRAGELYTSLTSKYILTGIDTLKYGAGVLKRIIVSDNIGGVLIYDNTAASGTIITDLDTAQGSEALGQVDFDIPFNNGLTIAITGDVGVTVVYE